MLIGFCDSPFAEPARGLAADPPRPRPRHRQRSQLSQTPAARRAGQARRRPGLHGEGEGVPRRGDPRAGWQRGVGQQEVAHNPPPPPARHQVGRRGDSFKFETVECTIVQTAVRLLLPGQLAVSEGTKAVTKCTSSN